MQHGRQLESEAECFVLVQDTTCACCANVLGWEWINCPNPEWIAKIIGILVDTTPFQIVIQFLNKLTCLNASDLPPMLVVKVTENVWIPGILEEVIQSSCKSLYKMLVVQEWFPIDYQTCLSYSKGSHSRKCCCIFNRSSSFFSIGFYQQTEHALLVSD